jgi:hypothetical protein
MLESEEFLINVLNELLTNPMCDVTDDCKIFVNNGSHGFRIDSYDRAVISSSETVASNGWFYFSNVAMVRSHRGIADAATIIDLIDTHYQNMRMVALNANLLM